MPEDAHLPTAFPGRLPAQRPNDRPLSAATKRLYQMWTPEQDIGNPFYTTFKYSRITGIGKDESRFSVSRRDPSKVLKIGDFYYVWYTRRRTKVNPVGRDNIVKRQRRDPHCGLGSGRYLLRHFARWI